VQYGRSLQISSNGNQIQSRDSIDR
jgi:hypothetical protein